MNVHHHLADLPLARKAVLASGAVLLIASFLPWYHVSLGAFGGASASGWHGVGVVAWLLVIVSLAIEGCRIADVLPLDDGRAELASLAAAGGVVLFGLIYVITRLTDGHLGFGLYIGGLGLAGMALGVVQLLRAGEALSALKELQSSAETEGS